MTFIHGYPSEGRSWLGRLHLSWPMLLLAGWLLYEFTAQPGLAALVACAKFGWADVRTAFWLRRVDPDRPRGRTCFWCYVSFGLWKVAVMATVMMIALGFLNALLDRVPRQQAANNGISPVLDGALAAAAMGFGLSSPAACTAFWMARRNGVRIWLGRAPGRAREERFWPPRDGRTNAAPGVSFTTFLMIVAIIVSTAVTIYNRFRPNLAGRILLVLGLLAALVLVPVGFFLVAPRWFAHSPQECWAAEEGEEVYQMRGTEGGVGEA